ncbi:MAG: fibronectin type III domain-containing protein, partial [bacterium]|nr:fibronectin type III domain-containing protein [bacterium]
MTVTSFNDTGLSAGTGYTYTIEAYDDAGNYSDISDSAFATTHNIVTDPIEVSVSAGNDDAEELPGGVVLLTSSDLELVEDPPNGSQFIGLRFTNISIPQGATITNAYVQFQVDEVSSGESNIVIQAEAADDAVIFTSTSSNISSRDRTGASVTWTPAAWPTVGAAGVDQQTSDISTVIQEVVNRTGWVSDNSIVLILTGTGERVAESYNGNIAGAPLLHVEYMDGPLPNQAPVVDTGPDQAIVLPQDTVTLTGSVTDDGLPDGSLTISWSELSGPGTVVFSSGNQAVTDATFDMAGNYILQLEASDGELTEVDVVTITVTDPNINLAPIVDAGPDQMTTLPQDTVVLAGNVTDDGLPSDTLSITWTQVSGPGTVVFSSGNQAVTNAIFDMAGSYVLQLEASDGELTETDMVNVTVEAPDIIPPSIPQNITATALSNSSIAVNWEASTDNTSVAGYEVYRDYVSVGTVTVTSFNDTGLSAGTGYTYTIEAYDDAGNYSDISDS